MSFIALAAIGVGCAHKPETCEHPPSFYVSVRASDHLNPDDRGRPLPTAIQLMQLKSTTNFDKMDFNDFWDKEKTKKELGDDLIKVEEITVDPGQSIASWYGRDGEASSIAVVGLFRKPSGSSWRSVAVLPEPVVSQCTATPQVKVGAPGADDLQLRFVVQDYEIRADWAAGK